MLLGKVFKFKCDFCEEEFVSSGYSLPEGMKWMPCLNGPIKHICKNCIEKDAHAGIKLGESGSFILS